MGVFDSYQDEGLVLNYTPAGAVSAGDVVFVGEIAGIAPYDIAANETKSINLSGCYSGDKESTTDTYSYGQAVYYDEDNDRCTPDVTDKYLGECIEDAVATDTKVAFRLNPANSPNIDAFVSQEVTYDQFTDDGGTSGHIDLTDQIPADSQVTGFKAVVATGFTGDTTAVIQVGDDSPDPDRFSAITTGSVLAAGTVGSQAGTANDFCAAATTVRVTVTGASDFGLITAGSMTVKVFYKPRP